jgi:hypothetical protein
MRWCHWNINIELLQHEMITQKQPLLVHILFFYFWPSPARLAQGSQVRLLACTQIYMYDPDFKIHCVSNTFYATTHMDRGKSLKDYRMRTCWRQRQMTRHYRLEFLFFFSTTSTSGTRKPRSATCLYMGTWLVIVSSWLARISGTWLGYEKIKNKK